MPRWIELVEIKPNGNVRPCLGSSAIMCADGRWNTDSLHAAGHELIDRERPRRPHVVGYNVLEGADLLTARAGARVRLPRVRVREHVSGQHVVGYLVGYAPTGYHVLEDGTVRYADYADADAEVIWND